MRKKDAGLYKMVKASAARRKMRDSFFLAPIQTSIISVLLISCSHHTVKEKDNAESYLSNGSHHHISFLFKNHLYSLNFVAVSRFGETRGIQFPVKKKGHLGHFNHDSRF